METILIVKPFVSWDKNIIDNSNKEEIIPNVRAIIKNKEQDKQNKLAKLETIDELCLSFSDMKEPKNYEDVIDFLDNIINFDVNPINRLRYNQIITKFLQTCIDLFLVFVQINQNMTRDAFQEYFKSLFLSHDESDDKSQVDKLREYIDYSLYMSHLENICVNLNDFSLITKFIRLLSFFMNHDVINYSTNNMKNIKVTIVPIYDIDNTKIVDCAINVKYGKRELYGTTKTQEGGQSLFLSKYLKYKNKYISLKTKH